MSGWAVHRLGKSHHIFTLVKDSASEVLMSWEFIPELSSVSPESQCLGRQAKDFRSFARVQVFRHSTFLFYTLGLQARVSTPDLSIHGNCLESGRQGAASNFSQYADSIPLIFKSVLKGYCFKHKKAQTGMRETVRAA